MVEIIISDEASKDWTFKALINSYEAVIELCSSPFDRGPVSVSSIFRVATALGCFFCKLCLLRAPNFSSLAT